MARFNKLDELLFRRYANFAVRISHMSTHGVFRNHQFTRDVRRIMSACHIEKNLPLTRGKLLLVRKAGTNFAQFACTKRSIGARGNFGTMGHTLDKLPRIGKRPQHNIGEIHRSSYEQHHPNPSLINELTDSQAQRVRRKKTHEYSTHGCGHGSLASSPARCQGGKRQDSRRSQRRLRKQEAYAKQRRLSPKRTQYEKRRSELWQIFAIHQRQFHMAALSKQHADKE